MNISLEVPKEHSPLIKSLVKMTEEEEMHIKLFKGEAMKAGFHIVHWKSITLPKQEPACNMQQAKLPKCQLFSPFIFA